MLHMINTDDPPDYGNADLNSDDDMGQNASDLGVIQNEDDELDVTRVPIQSDIDNSPAPEAGLPNESDIEDETDEDLFFDLETEMEFDLEDEEE